MRTGSAPPISTAGAPTSMKGSSHASGPVLASQVRKGRRKVRQRERRTNGQDGNRDFQNSVEKERPAEPISEPSPHVPADRESGKETAHCGCNGLNIHPDDK